MKAWFNDFHPLILLFIGIVIGAACMGLVYFKYEQSHSKPDVIPRWYKIEPFRDDANCKMDRIQWLSDNKEMQSWLFYRDEVPEFLKSLGVE